MNALASLQGFDQNQEDQTHSRLLPLIFNEKSKEKNKLFILDVGPATNPSLDFLANYRCKIHIADIMDLLVDMGDNNINDPQAIASFLNQAMPYQNDDTFNVVLLWDMLSYLHQPVFRTVMEHIGDRIQSRGFIHAFFAVNKDINDRPNIYSIIDKENLQIQAQSVRKRASVRYTQSDLKKIMPDLAIEKAVLLTNGNQEYLFRKIR